MKIREILEQAAGQHATDIFVIAGRPLCYTVNGQYIDVGESLMPPQTELIVSELYALGERSMVDFHQQHDDDFSFSISGVGRFRVNAFRQRGSTAAVLRVVAAGIPEPAALGIPESVVELYQQRKGLVLVTGPAGSGKSTTLACIIDKINQTRAAHIITLEEPIEYLHRHKQSIVSQREVMTDTASYARGLRAALRESPNVILLGEMRDYETIAIAMSAAETGQLIFSTLHTLGAANTVDRIVDVFPPSQQQQVRVQLAMVLKAVVSEQLVPTVDGRLVPVFEIVFCNNAISNMIRESKMHQLGSMIQSAGGQGMVSMDASLFDLYQRGEITRETLLGYALDADTVRKWLSAESK